MEGQAEMTSNARQPDVQVHHAAGCALCSSTEPHTHGQQEWRDLIDATPLPWDQKVDDRRGGSRA